MSISISLQQNTMNQWLFSIKITVMVTQNWIWNTLGRVNVRKVHSHTSSAHSFVINRKFLNNLNWFMPKSIICVVNKNIIEIRKSTVKFQGSYYLYLDMYIIHILSLWDSSITLIYITTNYSVFKISTPNQLQVTQFFFFLVNSYQILQNQYKFSMTSIGIIKQMKI